MKNSSLELVTRAPSAIAANSVSSLPQQWLDPSRGGQMIAPILSRKGTSKSRAFPKEKAHNERTPFPREQCARALRATQAPSAIAANSVSSLPQQRLDLSRGGQMIAPILSRKWTSKSGAFPKEKAHIERTPFPREQSARALCPTHKSCVSSVVRNADTDRHTS